MSLLLVKMKLCTVVTDVRFCHSWKTYWWPGHVKGTHGNFESRSLSDQDILLRYSHILKGNAPRVRTPLAHVHFLQAQKQNKMGYIYKLNIFPPFITYNF